MLIDDVGFAAVEGHGLFFGGDPEEDVAPANRTASVFDGFGGVREGLQDVVAQGEEGDPFILGKSGKVGSDGWFYEV